MVRERRASTDICPARNRFDNFDTEPKIQLWSVRFVPGICVAFKHERERRNTATLQKVAVAPCIRPSPLPPVSTSTMRSSLGQ